MTSDGSEFLPPRRPITASTSGEAGDALDDLIGSARRARRQDDALDDLIAAAGVGEDQSPEARQERRTRWELTIGLALAAIVFAGFITEVVASSLLVAGSGPSALAIVWPISGAVLLLLGSVQGKFVDRFARERVVVTLCLVDAALFTVVLVLFATGAPTAVPAALASILADQMMFLLPVVMWALAGDVFTAGQGSMVFPRISRWGLIGQISGLVVATVAPLALDALDLTTPWLVLIAPVVLVCIAVVVPHLLHDATTAAGHQRSETGAESLRSTLTFIRELPAFRWLLRASLLIFVAGTALEFGFLDVLHTHYDNAGDLQVVFAGTALVGFALGAVIQSVVTRRVISRWGVGRSLGILPALTAVGAAAMVIGGLTDQLAVVVAGVLVWRLPRWSTDSSARHGAQATLPDERRARAAMLLDLVPQALGLLLVPVSVGLTSLVGGNWLVPLCATAIAVAGTLVARNIATTWDDTQLSYRLKRRKRIA
ncbi:MAG: MFS transporter [Ilumatobacteraceae bacterium]